MPLCFLPNVFSSYDRHLESCEQNCSQLVNMLGGLGLLSKGLHLDFTLCLVAVWPSQKELTVCFCGGARCFCGFHIVLTWEGQDGLMFLWPDSPGALTLTISMSTLTSLTGVTGFFYLREFLVLLPLWFSIIYELTGWGERAFSPCSAPLVPVTFHGLGKHLGRGARRWTSVGEEREQGCHWREESLEELGVLDKDWDTSGSKWMEGSTGIEW